jgi:lauroyl/myristoyl acyltransferase
MGIRAAEGGAADLGRVLETVDRPSAHLAVRGSVPLFDRLYTSPRVHRLLPDWLALGLAALRARLLWRFSAERRARAIAQVALTLEGTGREQEVATIARRQIVEVALRRELKLRPWVARRYPVTGIENLDAARAAGKGVLLMGLHFGAPRATSGPLSVDGRRLYMAGADWLYADVYEGREGLVTLVQRQAFEAGGGRWVPRGGSYPVFRTLLDRGEVCLFHFDVPGSTETTFLGKPARLGSGLARLARETGALIVPAISEGGCRHPRVHLHDPVDPRGFASEQELVDHLAALATGFILDRTPEAWEPNDYPPLIFRELGEKYGWAFH